jgi:hypothetical protein
VISTTCVYPGKHDDRTRLQFGLWTRAAAVMLFLAVPSLSGCAGLLATNGVVLMAKGLPSNEPRWVEANRLTFAYPVTDVYALVEQEVERNGRKIVERDAQSRWLLVSYPFSLLRNNWGGKLKITCTADELGTTVTVVGDGRDAVVRVRLIGEELLEDVDRALRRQARML